MRVLLIGSGGREHALAWKLRQSPLLTHLYCAPGNAGIEQCATVVNLNPLDGGALADWAEKNKIDLTIVGPENPLAAGVVDVFEARGLKIFGPQRAAAQLESSKIFSKSVMLKAGIPTAPGAVFSDFAEAKSYVEKHGAPIVVKADGLCLGKGVVVAESVAEATAALEEFMVRGKFGDSSARVVIEQCLKGQEATVMAIVDGDSVLPLVISQDYKRLLDGDRGPNTGGMGAISPTPVLSEARLPELVKDIFHPVLRELQAQGIRYRGFLYAGVMVDDQGTVNVIEFNCRLGDPETEVLMMRLESDLLAAIDGAVSGRLESVKLEWSKDPAVCVVIAASGYPDAPEKGREIAGLFPPESRLAVFHSGTAKDSAGRVVTNGGRVLAVTALGANFNAALREAYRGVEQICFSGMHFRRDIGSGVKEG